MITPRTRSKEYIEALRKKLNRPLDPKLFEKVIFALTLLEQLKIHRLDFVFKGGTALLLATAMPKRFSIDIDIVTQQQPDEIAVILEKICAETIFIGWQDDNNRKHTPDAPVGHFKMFYKSSIDGREEPILLDVLYTPNPYPELMEIPIKHPWIETEGTIETVTMPTFAAILGDKLTAFAPKTTGILYTKDRSVEIIKQLYDIAFLFDNVEGLDIVKKSFARVVADEIRFRNLEIGPEDVLMDTFEACFVLSVRNESLPEFKQLSTGIRNFTNFTVEAFRIEHAIVAAAKVAYLISLMLSKEIPPILRYKSPGEIADWMIETPDYSKLNRLKKTNPEALFYWYSALNRISNNNE